MCVTCGCSNLEEHPVQFDALNVGSPASVVDDHGHHNMHELGIAHSHVDRHCQSHSHQHESHPREVTTSGADVKCQGQVLTLAENLLQKNDGIARENRRRFEAHGVKTINLLGSPGCGKTTLLERTLKEMSNRFSVQVIEGDQATNLDAMRIEATGHPVIQINTGAGCHLDAQMIKDAVSKIDQVPGSFVFIENVGNLVCPALFDLGERSRVVILSVSEGEDKPLKYPHMFQTADVLLFNKSDLLPYLSFDIELATARALSVNPRLRIISLSATTGAGMQTWLEWLQNF